MSTISKAYATAFSLKVAGEVAGLSVIDRLVYLGLLGLALGYAVLRDGGTGSADWSMSLLLLGVTGVAYWWRRAPEDLAPGAGRWMTCFVLALPAYVALQLVPLPVAWLATMSPERARILGWLGPVMAEPRFAALSVAPDQTTIYLFRILAYTLTFFMVRDIVGRSREQGSPLTPGLAVSRLAQLATPLDRGWRPAVSGWAAALPVIGIAAIEAVWGLFQLSDETGGVRGSYANRNHFAGLLEMVLPLTVTYGLALATRSRRSAGRWVTAIGVFGVAAAMVAALANCLSKMGFIAGIAGLFVTALIGAVLLQDGWKRWGTIGVIAALFPCALVSLPSDELVQRFGSATLAQLPHF